MQEEHDSTVSPTVDSWHAVICSFESSNNIIIETILVGANGPLDQKDQGSSRKEGFRGSD